MSYTQDDIKHMEEAIRLSATSAHSENNIPAGGPFGAVIYKGNQYIAGGYNHVLTDNDPTAHAEVFTIREACRKLKTFDLSGCVLYTSCEPCPMCLMAAKWANIDKIFFAATRKDAAEVGFRDDALYQLLKDGVYAEAITECRPAAQTAMREWHAKYAISGRY